MYLGVIMKISKFNYPDNIPVKDQEKMKEKTKWYNWQRSYVIKNGKQFAITSLNCFERILNLLTNNSYINKKIKSELADTKLFIVYSQYRLDKCKDVANKFFNFK
jgi:hypothetical protein